MGEKINELSQNELLCCRVKQWEPLLALFLHSPSPVGAAIHWVHSHGRKPFITGSSLASGLWKLVPELLAFKVALIKENAEKEKDFREKDDIQATIVGNCLWIETLPSIMQSSILTFLSAESNLFRSKDLEFLACTLLASSDLDFWVGQAATKLLHTVSGAHENSLDIHLPIGCKGYCTVPDWLKIHKQPYAPMFPDVCGLFQKPKRVAALDTIGSENVRIKVATDVTIEHNMVHSTTGQEMSMMNHEESTSCSVLTQLKPNDGVVDEVSKPNETVVLSETVLVEKAEVSYDQEIVKDIGPDLYSHACTLRERLMRMQLGASIADDIQVIRTSPATAAVLSVIKPWEFDNEVTLLLTENLLGKGESYLWSTNIMSFVILPKILSLEVSVSRILMTAVFHACKAHHRAAVDALLLPLTLCMQGPNTAQCEVVNRVVKECLPPDHTLSLCRKIFLQTRRQKLQILPPPPTDQNYLTSTLIWSGPMCVLIQNLLSQNIILDEDIAAELVAVVEKVAAEFSTSLKFSNLLLTLITKHGPHLVQFQSSLRSAVEKTNTFITKSALSKLAAL